MNNPNEPIGAISNEELEKYLWRETWSKIPTFTLRQAACLLSGFEPTKFQGYKTLPVHADSYLALLRRAVKLRALPAIELWLWMMDGDRAEVDPSRVSPTDAVADCTSVERDALRIWCTENRKPWPFAEEQSASGFSLDAFPPELRAAIEAFGAVRNNPDAMKGKTPKGALLAWLEANKPDLSDNARDRVSSVANWLPTGGAPKTPG